MSCFAYGMTGAGKTHTMLGEVESAAVADGRHTPGLSVLAVGRIFELLHERSGGEVDVGLRVSYLEIYNEQVRDLLVERSSPLMIVEDPVRGIFVPDLAELVVKDPRELLSLIRVGNSRRTIASTTANQFSSRSHAMLQISVPAVRLRSARTNAGPDRRRQPAQEEPEAAVAGAAVAD